MATRRHAREWAVQLLFQLDMNPPRDLGEAISQFMADKAPDAKARDFAERLVRGVGERLAEIDTLLTRHAKHWDLGRMSTLDRNILRMGTYELLANADVPAAVVINEAVDLAKFFGSTESGRFVNGILDAILHQEKPRRDEV